MEIRKITKDKKGAIGIIIFFSIVLFLLVIGFIAVIAVSIIDLTSDEVTPILTNLGVIEGTNVNMSEIAEYSIGTLDTVVQALHWIIALSYVLALVLTMGGVYIIGYNPHPAYIGLYIALMIMLIFGCIIISNMYEDIYTKQDEVAVRLQEQTIMSYLILHSPLIMAFVAAIGGILMFARSSTAEGGAIGGGGFGV